MGLRLWLLLFAFAATPVGAAGCSTGGEGSDLHTFTRPDVIGMPRGNASGTTFSGSYLITRATLGACRCRVGSCGGVRPMPGGVATITQQDGLFTFDLGTVCTGGADQDGSCWCGAALEEPENVAYGALEGKISVVNGRPTSIAFTIDQTGTATVNGRNYDCDFRSTWEATFQGP